MMACFLLLLSLCFTSCTTNNEYLKYEMTQYDYVEPSVPLEYQGEKSSFIIDSGCNNSVLYKNGIDAWFGSVDRLVKICNVKNSKVFINTDVYITVPVIMDDGTVINTSFLIDIQHDNKVNGLLGIDFMKNFHYVTFDYKNNSFCFNGPKIKASAKKFIFDSNAGILVMNDDSEKKSALDKIVFNDCIVQFDMKKNKVRIM